MNKTIASLLMFLALAVVLSACSASNCKSGTERQPGNMDAGTMGRDADTATLCTDKTDYNTGDTVHVTFTVKNALDEQIVLDGGQQPVMDICAGGCFSQGQTIGTKLTHLVLEPGESHILRWDWPAPEVDLSTAVDPTNGVTVRATWIGVRGGTRELLVQFNYGPRKGLP
jgi:hypothetical protein